jgi:exodeoxyribonuclease-5
MPDLSPDQASAFAAIERFLIAPRPRRPYFTLHGLAGTGKTHVLAALARKYRSALMCAFTGKAASVLRARTGLEVSTIHSAIYHFQGIHEDEDTGLRRPIFVSKEDAGLSRRIVLVDECSMIGEHLAEDLLDTGARIVACGDPGQLPPVRDAQFFNDPDAVLTEVHRQAWGSPIVRQAHAIRSTGRYQADGEAFRIISRATAEDHRAADIALCWRNSTRRALNSVRRSAFGRSGQTLLSGEPLMCLKNDHALKIYNGAVYEVARDRVLGAELAILADGRVLTLSHAVIEGFDEDFDDMRDLDGCGAFALAYAATTHKSQGSEWHSVMIIDECDYCRDRRALLYTGFTRAAERVTVVRTGG